MKDVSHSTTWEQINKQLKNNVAWNLMNDLDRLETFIAFIEKKRTIEEESKRRHVRQTERKNREGFRELLGECVSGGSLTFKGGWRAWLGVVKEDDRAVGMFKQHGSSAKDLFEEVKDGLVDKHKFIRDDFKKVLKNNPEVFQTSMLLSEFRAKLAGFEDFRNFENRESNDFEFYSSYLYEKYKKREDKSVKKFYKFMIRELGGESNPGLRDLDEKIAHNPQSASSFTALGPALRESLFSNYMAKRDSDEGVAEMLGKNRKDGKKKKTKKDKKSKTKKEKSSKTKDDYHHTHNPTFEKSSRDPHPHLLRKRSESSFRDRSKHSHSHHTNSIEKNHSKPRTIELKPTLTPPNEDLSTPLQPPTTKEKDTNPKTCDFALKEHREGKVRNDVTTAEHRPVVVHRERGRGEKRRGGDTDSEGEEGEIKNPGAFFRMGREEGRRKSGKRRRRDRDSNSRSPSSSAYSSYEKRKKRRRR